MCILSWYWCYHALWPVYHVTLNIFYDVNYKYMQLLRSPCNSYSNHEKQLRDICLKFPNHINRQRRFNKPCFVQKSKLDMQFYWIHIRSATFFFKTILFCAYIKKKCIVLHMYIDYQQCALLSHTITYRVVCSLNRTE